MKKLLKAIYRKLFPLKICILYYNDNSERFNINFSENTTYKIGYSEKHRKEKVINISYHRYKTDLSNRNSIYGLSIANYKLKNLDSVFGSFFSEKVVIVRKDYAIDIFDLKLLLK